MYRSIYLLVYIKTRFLEISHMPGTLLFSSSSSSALLLLLLLVQRVFCSKEFFFLLMYAASLSRAELNTVPLAY